MFFVMLSTANKIPIPLVTEDQDCYPALFEMEGEAETAADNNPLGRVYGYKVYEWG